MSNTKDTTKKIESKSRLIEILGVLHRNKISDGITPEKLRKIFEELGPTYVKIGQIMSMHSDILPQAYCDELMSLRSDVPPMSFYQMICVLEKAYGMPWDEIFDSIEEECIGSASIAQVHRAVLKDGSQVAVKVQRAGIYDVMARDIRLLKRAVKLIPMVNHRGVIDLDMVLDELWVTTQEEMNFLVEAGNFLEFARFNKDIAYVTTPHVYMEYTTPVVLVMEYIDGYDIDDRASLVKDGYDLDEVATKLVDNYLKQILEDGFFHADPHAGNVKVRDGKIVWLDMGMMGRLSLRDRNALKMVVQGIAQNDINIIQDAVMMLGDFKQKPDKRMLRETIEDLMARYGSLDLGEIHMDEVLQDFMEAMKVNHIAMPPGLTMLARGLSHVEGILSFICPSINMISIAEQRFARSMFEGFELKSALKKGGTKFYRAIDKSFKLPGLMEDVLKAFNRGQSMIHLEIGASDSLSELLHHLVRNVIMGLWIMALLISSSIICTTDMRPKILGIPALGMIGYVLAFAIAFYLIVRHFFGKDS